MTYDLYKRWSSGSVSNEEFEADFDLIEEYRLKKIPGANQPFYDFALDLITIYNAFHERTLETIMKFYSNISVTIPEKIQNPELILELSPAQVMDGIERTIGRFVTLLSVFAQLFNQLQDNKQKAYAESLYCGFATEFNAASEILFRKYAVPLLNQFSVYHLEDNQGFISDADWPLQNFFEANGYGESAASFIHTLSLIFYGETSKPITITFRDESRGAGATFDHYNIQRITGRETAASVAPGMDANVLFEHLDNVSTTQLSQGRSLTHSGKKRPYILDSPNADDMSFVVIPGYSSTTIEKRPEIQKTRTDHEKQLIRYARNAGVPVLAICGGIDTLVQTFGGTVENLAPKRRKKHTSKMPQLDKGQLTNVEIPHHIAINPTSKLALFMFMNSLKEQLFVEATSVHWFSVKKMPDGFICSAVAAHKNPNGNYIVDKQVIEAIEAPETSSTEGNGVSIIATQYHPEATDPNLPGQANALKHHGLFKALMIEGDNRNRVRTIKRELYCRNLSSQQFFLEILSVPENALNQIKKADRSPEKYWTTPSRIINN